MFTQQQKSGSYENTGVGLGLSYCKMVIEKMNGEIECVSAEGRGTLISFYVTVKCSLEDKGLSRSFHKEFSSKLRDKVSNS